MAMISSGILRMLGNTPPPVQRPAGDRARTGGGGIADSRPRVRYPAPRAPIGGGHTMASLKDQCAIVGLGVTRMGRLPEFSGREVARWALDLALEDAGLGRAEVDGLLYVGGAESDTYDCR